MGKMWVRLQDDGDFIRNVVVVAELLVSDLPLVLEGF